MKTPARTTLPDNPHEQPVYEIKSKWFRYSFYFSLIYLLFIHCFFWWYIIYSDSRPAEPPYVLIAVTTPAAIVCVAIISTLGDIYFYERYVEIRRFLPFMKRFVIYYDKMHVRVRKDGIVTLNHYETQPKCWKSPYTWFKASFIDAINIPLFSTPEIREFAKTKVQSVSYSWF